MIKKLFTAVLALMAFCNVVGAATHTTTFTRTDFTQKGQTCTYDGDVSWTNNGTWKAFDTLGAYFGWSSTKALQFGSTSNPCSEFSLTSGSFAGKTVTKVTVNSSTGTAAEATCTVSVGGKSFGTKTLTTDPTDYEFTGSASGDVVVSWAQTTERALYVKTITVEYEDAAGGSQQSETTVYDSGVFGTLEAVWNVQGPKSINGVDWTLSAELKEGATQPYFARNSTKGQQLGTANNPFTTINISTNAFAKAVKITKVEVNSSTATGSDAVLSVTVGGKSFGTQQTLSTTASDYAFEGDATGGNVVLTWTQTPENAKALYVKSIKVTYEKAAASVAKPVITLSSEATTNFAPVTVTINCETEGADIYYTLDGTTPSDASTAYAAPFTVSENATIKAIAYKDGESSEVSEAANLTFGLGLANLAEFNALGSKEGFDKNTLVSVANDVTAIYHNRKYLYVKDASGYALLFDTNSKYTNTTINNGDVIPGGFFGKYAEFNMLPEMAYLDGVGELKAGSAVEPLKATVADITAENVNMYVKLSNVKLTTPVAKTFDMTDETGTVSCYNQFTVDMASLDTEKTYDVEGFVSISYDPQFYPISITEHVAGTLTASPKEINLWGFAPATELYYNTHKAIFHVEAENCTENITYVMQSSGKAKGTTSPRLTVATSGLYENRSGNLNITCSSSKAADISDVVVIKSGDVEENVTVNVKIASTQYNGEGIFEEDWDECRPFTMADLNAIHAVMPQNTTWATEATHEYSMYFPKLRYFQGVVSAIAADASGKVSFTLADAEGDATVKVVDAQYKDGQAPLKVGDKVVLSGDFGDVEGELQILTSTIEEITEDAPADDTVYGTYAAPAALEDGKTYGMNADVTGGQFNYYTFESAEDVKITLTTTPGTNPGGGFGVSTGNFLMDDQYNDLEGAVDIRDELTTDMIPVGGGEGGEGGEDDFGVGFGNFTISSYWNAKAGVKYYIMCQGVGSFTVALSEPDMTEKVGTTENPINLNETPTWTWGTDGKVPGSATHYTFKAEKDGNLTISNGNEELYVGEDGWYDPFVNTSGPQYTGEIKKVTNWSDYTAAYTFAVEEGVTYCITIFDLTKGNDGEVIKAEFVEATPDDETDNVEWDPAPGEIDYNLDGHLDQVILTFTDAGMVEVNDIPFKANIEDETGREVDSMYGVNFYFLGWNQACITFNKGVTADGTYTVNVPAGLFTLTMPDGTTKASSELHATYIVTGVGEGPTPGGKIQILPAEGNVTSLQQFTLVLDGMDSQFSNYEYKAQFYKDGELVEEVEFDYNPDDWFDTKLYASLSAPVTEDGTYTLEFPVGSMTTDCWLTSNTEPVVYTWTIGEGGGEEELPIGTYAEPIALEDGKTYGLNAAETGMPNFYTFESDKDVKVILTPTEGSIVESGFAVSIGNFLMDDQYNELEGAEMVETMMEPVEGGSEPGIGGDDELGGDDFGGDDFGWGMAPGRMATTWTAKAGVKYYILTMGQGSFDVALGEPEEYVGTVDTPINLNETTEWTWGTDGKLPGSTTYYTYTAEKDGNLTVFVSNCAENQLYVGEDGWYDPYLHTEGPAYTGEIKTDYNWDAWSETNTFAVEAGTTYYITIFDLYDETVKVSFEDATGISVMQNAECRMQNAYNIRGQKVDAGTFRGIVIKNGKKVIVK